MRPHQHPPVSGFTIIEVMIATLVLAVGIAAALSSMSTTNNLRKSLDENSLADLVLRQMTARLQTVSINQLGSVYATPANKAEGWTLHLRATAVTGVAAATRTAAALAQPYSSSTTYAPPFPPLTELDLVDAGILRERIGLKGLELYIEYYNLSTETGLQNVGGMLIPVENGLIKRFNELQDANPTGSPRQAWFALVGDPSNALAPTDSQAANIIMPATFSIANVDQPGTTSQIRGAFNHGLVIRVLVSWQPGEIQSPTSTVRQWRETVIVKKD